MRKIKDLQIRYKPEVSRIVNKYLRLKPRSKPNEIKIKKLENLVRFYSLDAWHTQNVSAQMQECMFNGNVLINCRMRPESNVELYMRGTQYQFQSTQIIKFGS